MAVVDHHGHVLLALAAILVKPKSESGKQVAFGSFCATMFHYLDFRRARLMTAGNDLSQGTSSRTRILDTFPLFCLEVWSWWIRFSTG